MTDWISITLWAVTVLALAYAGISFMSATYYNHQRHLIIMGQREEPKPWYVRVFEMFNRP